mmetsp:Transcript_50393/g.50748  ORF Transcript_50393/g.50748 Transcript_50393/m.50748 type:complete len:141 (+) Transcript_50393:331-753(+)
MLSSNDSFCYARHRLTAALFPGFFDHSAWLRGIDFSRFGVACHFEFSLDSPNVENLAPGSHRTPWKQKWNQADEEKQRFIPTIERNLVNRTGGVPRMNHFRCKTQPALFRQIRDIPTRYPQDVVGLLGRYSIEKKATCDG